MVVKQMLQPTKGGDVVVDVMLLVVGCALGTELIETLSSSLMIASASDGYCAVKSILLSGCSSQRFTVLHKASNRYLEIKY